MSSKPTVTKTNQKTNETSTSSPWGPAAGYLTDLYASGKSAFDATNNKLFGGDFVTPANENQRSAVQQFLAAAPSLMTGAGDLRSMAQRIASGEFLDPNNPILQGGIRAVQDPIKLDWANMILPQITDASIKGGAYGGTSQKLAEVEGASRLTRDLANNAAGMTLDWTNQRFGDIFRSPELFKTANMLDLAPATVTAQAGDYQRSLDDYATQDERMRYENELMAPWFGVDDFTRLLTAGGYGTRTGESTSSGTTTSPAPDMATQLLQGGLGGLSTLASLGKAFPATMGSLGSILGGLGGSTGLAALAPILSDRRYKEHIKRIGQADNGLPIYLFRYAGMPTWQIGFMADEVEKIHPEAVHTTSGGVKHVDYSKAVL